jgi:hypothetical protein
MTDPWNTTAPLETHLQRARAAGIGRTVVFAPFHSDYALANAEVARIIAQHPDELIGFAFVHAKRDTGRVMAMVEYAISRWRFRGIKVHGSDALPTREVCEAAKRFRVPILVDVVGKAHVIDMLAPEYPDIDFIVPHLGSFSDDWRAQSRVVDQLVRYPNVFADTSGVRRFDYLVEAVERAGARKLLFGSDGPWLHPAVELHKVKALELPPHQERLVLGGNLRRLLGSIRIPRRAPAPVPRQRGTEAAPSSSHAQARERDYEL